MKILMFGWEFPPFNQGGLGTACHGLTKGLVNQGHAVTFVLPKAKDVDANTHVNLVVADNVSFDKSTIKVKEVDSLLHAYMDSTTYSEKFETYSNYSHNKKPSADDIYGKDLFHEVSRFSQKAGVIAAFEDFEVIHAHDWMTYGAGIRAKQVSGKPLVVHVHATEFDRTGGNGVNQAVYDIERKGMHLADSIIAVSNYTKEMVVKHYGIPPDKVSVVHNSVAFNDDSFAQNNDFKIKKHDKIVLFLGRITLQKGPDYFLQVAKMISENDDNVKFIVAGSGDMEGGMINKAAELGISDKVLFAGFLRGKEIDKAFSMADVYVMPSVSEPFGITPLEAIRNGTPCVISKQSGVSEVLRNCFKVDFWDTKKMADMVMGILKYDSLNHTMKENAIGEIKTFSWDKSAQNCAEVYQNTINQFGVNN